MIEIGEVAVLDQAVTDADAARQAVQNLAAPGSLDPERQLGDLDTFLVHVHAEEIVGQNFTVGDIVEQIAKMFGLGQQVFDLVVHAGQFGLHEVERHDQEHTGATGGINNAQGLQAIAIGLPGFQLS
ncbi:hypothetical protein LOM8899_04370 [Flavimaricola marinus]|uniref:Uncharacterized protein n=1 Tax=Flavimaricola marinus TaxID=1819565 RepID=A0A238LLB4_9RHOB|nr:hypothetical protein LOM8899_04370 [Flavimaricola marinus]